MIIRKTLEGKVQQAPVVSLFLSVVVEDSPLQKDDPDSLDSHLEHVDRSLEVGRMKQALEWEHARLLSDICGHVLDGSFVVVVLRAESRIFADWGLRNRGLLCVVLGVEVLHGSYDFFRQYLGQGFHHDRHELTIQA